MVQVKAGVELARVQDADAAEILQVAALWL